jgi:NTE family protein
MVQLQFTNRLKLDEKLFEKVNDFVELVERIDESVDPDDPIRQEDGYKKLRKHKKIDAASVIRANLPHELTNASDFSKASIEERIEAGYRDAMEQKIGEYTPTKKELARVKAM